MVQQLFRNFLSQLGILGKLFNHQRWLSNHCSGTLLLPCWPNIWFFHICISFLKFPIHKSAFSHYLVSTSVFPVKLVSIWNWHIWGLETEYNVWLTIVRLGLLRHKPILLWPCFCFFGRFICKYLMFSKWHHDIFDFPFYH